MHSVASDIEILRRAYNGCAWPSLYYGVVTFLLKGKNAKNVAEIGVAYGYHAHCILQTNPGISYFGIDPYLPDYDPEDVFCREVSSFFSEPDRGRAMARLRAVVSESLSVYGERVTLCHKKSEDAARDFHDGFFDLVFVDGDHTYNGVKADLNSWWPKIKSGGILCGDDWRSFEGVRAAVNEFAERNALHLKSTEKPGTNNPIWLIEK